MQTKICTKCMIDLHVSFFYRRKDRDSLTSHCRDCIRETMAFRKDRYATARKQYYEKNRLYLITMNRIYQANNPDKVKRWSETKTERLIAKDPEAYRANARRKYYDKQEYHAAKRKERREKFKAEEEANRTRWRKANMGIWASYNQRYRAKKASATPPWANHDDIISVYEAAAWMTASSGEPFEVDHIVPLTSDRVCGLHCAANLQILSATENRSKGNRYWPDMW